MTRQTTVSVPQYITYRDLASIKDPDTFAPERWLEDPKCKDDNRAAVQPFNVGPRNCIGQKYVHHASCVSCSPPRLRGYRLITNCIRSHSMAWHEMRLFIVKVLYNFDLELVDNKQDWADQNCYCLWEKKPLICRVKPAAR
jgi:hypothetical protein